MPYPAAWVKKFKQLSGPNGSGQERINYKELSEFKHIDEVDCHDLVQSYVEYLFHQKCNGLDSNEPDLNGSNTVATVPSKQNSKANAAGIAEQILQNQKEGIAMLKDNAYVQIKRQKVHNECQMLHYSKVEYLMKKTE